MKKQTNLWIPLCQSYIQFFAMHFDIIEITESLTHINGDGTSRTFPFIFQWKRVDQGIGRRELWFVSFERQIDGEAVTRMSGRCQMISLRDLS